MICAWIETSRAEIGSSQTMKSGSSASARAMPTLWRWPPENSCGYWRMWAAESPTRSSSSPTRRRRSLPRAMPWIASGSPTMLSTVMRGFSEP